MTRPSCTRSARSARSRSEKRRRWSPHKGDDGRSTSTDSRSSSSRSDGSKEDEIVHYSWAPGQILNRRYRLEELSGDGTFGRVCLATDLEDSEHSAVAVKIIRDVRRYLENAKVEAKILECIRREDRRGKHHCCLMYDTFIHESKFFCLVFEPLGSSLYDFIKKNHFRGLWLADLQKVAKQTLKALQFLHERLQLTHTDLKAENILFVRKGPGSRTHFPRQEFWEAQGHSTRDHYWRPDRADIKLIDFGNATFKNEHHASIINTRQYRGPEVVLELGWDHQSDIWSVGCILMELYTGELLFGTHENLEHLALMEKILGGLLPQDMLAAASSDVRNRYLTGSPTAFHRYGWRLNWPEGAASYSSHSHVASQKTLAGLVRRKEIDLQLVDLVQSLLRFRPSERPRAERALSHEFFDHRLDE